MSFVVFGLAGDWIVTHQGEELGGAEGRGERVLKRRNDFYFYFSIASLLFIFVLIYYFYEMKFNLAGFLDVKTILTVLGTLLGAYFGASVAGVNALKISQANWSKNEKEANSHYYSSGFALETILEDIIYYTNEIIEFRKKCSELPLEIDFTRSIRKNIEVLKLLINEVKHINIQTLHPVLSSHLISVKSDVNRLSHHDYIVNAAEEISLFYNPITDHDNELIHELEDIIDDVEFIKGPIIALNKNLINKL